MVNSLCRPPESLRFWNRSHLQTKEERNQFTGRGYLAQGLSEFGSKIMQMCTSDMASGVGKIQFQKSEWGLILSVKFVRNLTIEMEFSLNLPLRLNREPERTFPITAFPRT